METCKLNIPKFKALLLFSIALLFAINAIGQSNLQLVMVAAVAASL